MSEPSRKLPKILITNDDGIESLLLRSMIARLSGKYHLIVVAPAAEKSFCGRSFSFQGDVKVEKMDEWECPAYAVDGTPSDCVNIALGHLCEEEHPDLVLSGPNIGRNTSLGFILGSGTIAGALEGSFWGIQALAVSQGFPNIAEAKKMKALTEISDELTEVLERSLDFIEEAIEQVLAEEPRRLCVHSVNLPHRYSDGEFEFVRAIPVDYHFGSFFCRKDDGVFMSGSGKRIRLTDRNIKTDI